MDIFINVRIGLKTKEEKFISKTIAEIKTNIPYKDLFDFSKFFTPLTNNKNVSIIPSQVLY